MRSRTLAKLHNRLHQFDYVKSNVFWLILIYFSVVITIGLVFASFLIDWAGGLILIFGILQGGVLIVAWQLSYPLQVRMRELENKVVWQDAQIKENRLLVIDLTSPEKLIENGTCAVCKSKSLHLHNYPLHPDAHNPGCHAIAARAKALAQTVESFRTPKTLPKKALEKVG